MHSSAGGSGEEERIPRIASGWDPRSCSLTPAEGFLLSRIDGHTPWKVLREIGAISPEQVDRYLERWAKEGIIEIGGAELGEPDHAPRGADAARAERSRIDPGLDLSPELQERILEFESSLDRPYYDLLGVDRSADAKEIKRAYFRLSKEFHPDRYFRRNIGEFAGRLDRIFKSLCEAYELLSDPATRAEIERSLGPPPPQEGAYSGAGATDRIGPEPPSRPRGEPVSPRMRHLQRLRARFRVPQKVLLERQFKAKQFYRSAQAAAHEKRWLEAAASMRLAIAFDPTSPEYKKGLAGIQADVHRVRAEALIAEAADSSAQGDALRLLEEALHYKPCDVALNERTAKLALELSEMDRALECAETLCEVDPDEARHHVLLARVLRRKGERQRAAEAIDRAAELDPKAEGVADELRQQGRRGRRR